MLNGILKLDHLLYTNSCHYYMYQTWRFISLLEVYIDDVLSINKPTFKDYLHGIYRHKPELKGTTGSDRYVFFFKLIGLDDTDKAVFWTSRRVTNGTTSTSRIANFPFLISCSNIPSSSAYCFSFCQILVQHVRIMSSLNLEYYNDTVLYAFFLSWFDAETYDMDSTTKFTGFCLKTVYYIFMLNYPSFIVIKFRSSATTMLHILT